MANGTIAASQLEMLTQSGTGIITIVPPATNTNRTLTLPDSTGTVATAESTLSQFNASGSAPVYACRAWVNFNGTGTVAIRASGNVSSITDDGTGQYRVNFTTAMPDAKYTTVISINGNSDPANTFSTNSSTNSFTQTASAAVVCTKFNGGTYDTDQATVAIFR